ncbi:MAG TPA: hypothetical protein VFP83_08890 [Candidatus Limnocylindria bacterium]|nr:hypothetical protein [Candidatus Limnocylindria bacterium]
MTDAIAAEPGWDAVDAQGRRLGTVDAVFADYLLVRTGGFLPVDLYVPITAVSPGGRSDAVELAAADADEAYRSWHRPLKRAPHE